MNSEIMVSVWCVTYNHKKYIRQALKGIISQKTNFPYEIVVFDDASTDGTSDILLEYSARYSSLIKPIIMRRNIYKNPNRQKIIEELREQYTCGKYIAICEGDDFWTDDNKLQKQVRFMETHPECSLYMHDAICINFEKEAEERVNAYPSAHNRYLTAEEVIMHYYGHPPNASMLLKRRDMMNLPKYVRQAPVGDYSMQLYLLSIGKIYYSDEIMSCYRKYTEGSYTARIKEDKMLNFKFNLGMINTLYEFDYITGHKYHKWCINKQQMFLSGIIDNLSVSIDVKEYYEQCVDRGNVFPEGCEKFFGEIRRIRDIIYGNNLPTDILRFIEASGKVVIMGTGKYSHIISNHLKMRKEISGYAVTEKTEGIVEFFGKPVWQIDEIPVKNYSLLIAINPLRWDEIEKTVKQNNIETYYCPFLINMEREE